MKWFYVNDLYTAWQTLLRSQKLACERDSPVVYADLSIRSIFRDVLLSGEVFSLLMSSLGPRPVD
jgi:hypothetical protein